MLRAEDLLWGCDPDGTCYLKVPDEFGCKAPYRILFDPLTQKIEAWGASHDGWGDWCELTNGAHMSRAELKEAMLNFARLGLDTGIFRFP